MENEKARAITHEVRAGLTMILHAVDEASDSSTVIKAAVRDAIPGAPAVYLKHYEAAKANAMQGALSHAFAQAGVLDRMIRLFEEIREKK